MQRVGTVNRNGQPKDVQTIAMVQKGVPMMTTHLTATRTLGYLMAALGLGLVLVASFGIWQSIDIGGSTGKANAASEQVQPIPPSMWLLMQPPAPHHKMTAKSSAPAQAALHQHHVMATSAPKVEAIGISPEAGERAPAISSPEVEAMRASYPDVADACH